MRQSIAFNTGNTSGSYGNKKKRASWSSVDNGALMKRKRGNDLWFWFYEFLIKTIYAETNLYKIGKGAAWNYSIKLTPPQVFVFNSELLQIVGARIRGFSKFFSEWGWEVHENNISFSEKILLQGKWSILGSKITYHRNLYKDPI